MTINLIWFLFQWIKYHRHSSVTCIKKIQSGCNQERPPWNAVCFLLPKYIFFLEFIAVRKKIVLCCINFPFFCIVLYLTDADKDQWSMTIDHPDAEMAVVCNWLRSSVIWIYVCFTHRSAHSALTKYIFKYTQRRMKSWRPPSGSESNVGHLACHKFNHRDLPPVHEYAIQEQKK